MLGCPWTVSGLWMQGHEVQADDGDWGDDGGHGSCLGGLEALVEIEVIGWRV